MPIVVKHQAAGIAPSPENPRLKYGMMMTMQQQRADQEMRQRAQDAQYDMQRMGMMAQNQVPRQPSLGEETAMLDQEIRSGMYDPDTVKALRDDERAMRLILRDRNIDATQRAQALENIQSRMRMARSTGKIQPMMQPRPTAQGQQMQQPHAPLSAREAFRSDPKLFNEYKSRAQVFFDGSGKTPTTQMILDRAAQEYEAEQAWFNSSPAQNQSNPSTTPGQVAPVGQPQASVPQAMSSDRWGAREYGAENVLAMPASPPIPGVQTGASLPASLAGQQPTRQQPMYPVEATGGIGVDPSYMAQPDSGFASARTFTSADGRSMVGSVVGINPPSSNGGFSTVQIRKESDGKVYDVPLNNLSQQDQQYVLSGGNQDTMYDLQNQNRSAGTNFMDPNNPVRQQMSAADQSIVNPQKQTLGQAGGRYGMGMVDYGINPATGNRVTASIRPGSTMPEYDPPEPTGEQLASDNAAKQKQREFNERVRKNQGKSTGKKTLVAGGANAQGGQMQTDASQDAPALTQLLATMTPSQRRDYSKWLMEEPDRYAMRNQIAQQQLNRTATAAAGSGQLPAYPGLQKRIQERNQQQGRSPMQGQMPTQGNLGQPSPPVEMGIDQALAIAKNPNASPEDQKRAAEIMVKNGIATLDQAKEVIGRVTSPPVTDQGDILDPNDPLYQDKRGAVSSQKPPAVKTPVQPAQPKQEEPTNKFMGRDVSNFRPRGWGDVPPAAPASPVTKPKPKATLRPMIGLSEEEKSRVLGNEKPSDIKRQTKVPVGQSPTMAQLEGGRESTVNQETSDAQMETRTWTSADGKKTFEGSLAGLSYDNVTGRRIAVINSTDGQVFKIPIESFSEDDQSRLLAVSAIEKSRDWHSKYGGEIGIGKQHKTRPKGRARGASTNPSSK